MPMHLENPKQRVTKEITYAITNDQPIDDKHKPDDSQWKYNTKGSTNGWNHDLSSRIKKQYNTKKNGVQHNETMLLTDGKIDNNTNLG